MDKRFEDLVLEEIRTNKAVEEIEGRLNMLRDLYDDEDVWQPADADRAAQLAHQLEEARRTARNLAEAFWVKVRPKAAFLHKRYITEDRQPERCVITKLEYCRHGCLFQVYYRTADGAGMRTKCSPQYFRSESFKEWA